MARLKAKRFRQIFKYLDQNQDGLIDLLDLTTGKTLSLQNICLRQTSDVRAFCKAFAFASL